MRAAVETVLTIGAKTLLGGVLVLVFAALSTTLKPKRLAGILAAAPSVAIAGLAVGAAAKGPADQAASARTMVAGAIALVVYAAVAIGALKRFGALRGALVSFAAWVVAALVLYPVVSD
jgi:uncharacterized membrane protein (GlpM family)